MQYPKSALILAGHGSTENTDSSVPIRRLAQSIRERGYFGEVHVAFWKEEPAFRDVLHRVTSKEIYLVPCFLSEGYFTQEILPREFGLKGSLSQIEGKLVHYCKPLGEHPSITQMLILQAQKILRREDLDHKQGSIFLAAHGTPLNENSKNAVRHQVECLRASGIFRDCHSVFLEEAPFLREWRSIAQGPYVIVLPYFISDGLHVSRDLPKQLGIPPDHGNKKQCLQDRILWCAQAIGRDPRLLEVVLEIVKEAP